LIRSFKLILAVFFGFLPLAASAQTKLDRNLGYIDLGVQGIGEFTKNVSGPITVPAVDTGSIVTQAASNSAGALATIRFAPRPYFGVEFNGSYGRFTENFSQNPYQIQTNFNEFTFGYVVTPPYTIFGVKPYASAGGGIIRFAPTTGGGQGAIKEGRPGVYYNVGIQKDVLGNFGVRLGFRQLFYTAPDFYANYLTISKRTVTSEPMIGFYLRF
jgi:hypothetical protein